MLVHAVSDYLVSKGRKRTGEAMTQLSLQKMLYFSQGWHLAIRSESLFTEEVRAWRHGPVVREIYSRFRHYGDREIGEEAMLTQPDAILSKATMEFLDRIWDSYSGYTAPQLVGLTHREGPWKTVRGPLGKDADSDDPIPEELMIEYFANLYTSALRPGPLCLDGNVLDDFEKLATVQ